MLGYTYFSYNILAQKHRFCVLVSEAVLKDPYRIVAFDDFLIVDISTTCFLLG